MENEIVLENNKEKEDINIKENQLENIINENTENKPQIKLNEFALFRNDIISQINEINNKLDSKLKEQTTQNSNFYESLKEQMNKINEKNNYLSETILSIKIEKEKIEEFDSFKKKIEQQLITHDIHLNEVIKDLSNAKFKYDKIFIENLTVPGYVGQSAKYKTISDCLNSLINETSMNNSERIQIKNELKELKKKQDNVIKDVLSIVNNAIKRCNEYSDSRDNLLKEKMENEIKLANEKLMDLRIDNVKSAVNLEKKTNEFMNEWDKIIHIKEEIESKVQNNINIFKNDAEIAVKRYNDMKIEFNKIKSRFGLMVDFIKDVRFAKNLNVSRDDVKRLTQKLSFKRKDSKNSEDLKNVDLDFNINDIKNRNDNSNDNNKNNYNNNKKNNNNNKNNDNNNKDNNNNNDNNDNDDNNDNKKLILSQNNFYKKYDEKEYEFSPEQKKMNSTYTDFYRLNSNNNNKSQNSKNIKSKNTSDTHFHNINDKINNDINNNNDNIIIEKKNVQEIKNYSLIEMNIQNDNKTINPGLIITKNNNDIKKKFRVRELISSDNLSGIRKKKINSFVQIKNNENKNQIQSFGRTISNNNREYINCSQRKSSSQATRGEEKLNLGFVPISKIKLKKY